MERLLPEKLASPVFHLTHEFILPQIYFHAQPIIK